MSAALTFAVSGFSLYAAHHVADHWIQRETEALGKGAPTWVGRLLCARHVVSMTVTKLVVLVVTFVVLDLPLSGLAVTLGLAVDAVAHYVADRRTPLARLACWAGKGRFWALGNGPAAPAGTGAYALDQSWHVAWLWVAALIIAAA
jgi:hypothetical protein